jgi:hypothetical protein
MSMLASVGSAICVAIQFFNFRSSSILHRASSLNMSSTGLRFARTVLMVRGAEGVSRGVDFYHTEEFAELTCNKAFSIAQSTCCQKRGSTVYSIFSLSYIWSGSIGCHHSKMYSNGCSFIWMEGYFIPLTEKLPLFGHLIATWLVFMSLPSYEKWIGYDCAIETVFNCLIESVGWRFCFYAQELVAKSISIHYGKFGEVDRPIMHQIVWMNILMTWQKGVFVLKWFT